MRSATPLTRQLSVEDPRWFRPGPRVRTLIVLLGCLFIVNWQGFFSSVAPWLDGEYRIQRGLTGAFGWPLKRFFHFYYYTDLFPVTVIWNASALDNDEASARSLLVENPFLANEHKSIVATGDYGKLLLLYPSVWWNGKTPLDADFQTFNRLFATTSLVLLFVSLCLLRHHLLAVVLVAVIGGHPYAVYHLHAHDDIWGYPIALGSVLLALCAPLILRRVGSRWELIIPLIAGPLLAFAREVRSEPALLLLSVAGVCVLARRRWTRRLALLTLLAVSFGASSLGWSVYWETKFTEARQVVEAAGGRYFDGHRNQHHSVWHPIWCGLGDFGKDRGYAWRDRAAYGYAIRRINRMTGSDYQLMKDIRYLDEWTDENQWYRVKPEALPGYSEALRHKIMWDISRAPGWYAEVLRKRLRRILRNAPPVRIGRGLRTVDIPFSGWWALPVLAAVLLSRRREQLLLLLFFVPTSLTALLVFSGRGITNATAFNHVAFALLSCWLVHLATAIVGSARRTVSTGEGGGEGGHAGAKSGRSGEESMV